MQDNEKRKTLKSVNDQKNLKLNIQIQQFLSNIEKNQLLDEQEERKESTTPMVSQRGGNVLEKRILFEQDSRSMSPDKKSMMRLNFKDLNKSDN